MVNKKYCDLTYYKLVKQSKSRLYLLINYYFKFQKYFLFLVKTFLTNLFYKFVKNLI